MERRKVNGERLMTIAGRTERMRGGEIELRTCGVKIADVTEMIGVVREMVIGGERGVRNIEGIGKGIDGEIGMTKGVEIEIERRIVVEINMWTAEKIVIVMMIGGEIGMTITEKTERIVGGEMVIIVRTVGGTETVIIKGRKMVRKKT
jgi:hypothetical protein